MIKIKLGIILLITDAYTRSAVETAGLSFRIDGREARAMKKPGGFYVFADIPEGVHTITIRSVQYEEAQLAVTTGQDVVLVALQPGSAYSFRGTKPERLVLQNKSGCEGSAEKRVWIAQDRGRLSMKIAQPELKAGDTELRLYFEDIAQNQTMPAAYLVADGAQSEIIRIENLYKDEPSPLADGLKYAHKRGCMVYPAFCVRFGNTDGAAEQRVCLQPGAKTWIFAKEGSEPVALSEGLQLAEV